MRPEHVGAQRIRRLAIVLGALGVAVPAWAQSRRSASTASADSGTNSADAAVHRSPGEDPAAFHDEHVSGANVGSGGAAESGPVGEVRGSNAGDAPDQNTGPIDAADLARLMALQLPRLRPCYDHARATHPTLAGRIDVQFTVGADGHVTRSAAGGLPDAPEVATCVADLVRQTTFPHPQTPPLQFLFPINFQPPAAPANGHGHGAHGGSAHSSASH